MQAQYLEDRLYQLRYPQFVLDLTQFGKLVNPGWRNVFCVHEIATSQQKVYAAFC